jgi:hypothetical protein
VTESAAARIEARAEAEAFFAGQVPGDGVDLLEATRAVFEEVEDGQRVVGQNRGERVADVRRRRTNAGSTWETRGSAEARTEREKTATMRSFTETSLNVERDDDYRDANENNELQRRSLFVPDGWQTVFPYGRDCCRVRLEL